MLPAFLIRACVDSIRHNEQFKDSNPYSRCEEVLKLSRQLWRDQFGRLDSMSLEPSVLAAYWEEFFQAEHPLTDEKEWREGLAKRSGPYESFADWQEWFKENYSEVYQDNDIWQSIIMSAWAFTHQKVVRFHNNKWQFLPASPYLPTSAMWLLEPHFPLVRDTLRTIWTEELRSYAQAGFHIRDEAGPLFGNVECLGFDDRAYTLYFPTHSKREPMNLDSGTLVADIVAPVGGNGYRQLDQVIFTSNFVDITALTNRARYVFTSQRRILELLIDYDTKSAHFQAAAEGWLVRSF